MNQMQKKLLGILKWFHQYCIEHGLKYYILGGSLIGAVRHKGFIPWDDDIDVGMPRKDYERFLQLTSGMVINHFKVEKMEEVVKNTIICLQKYMIQILLWWKRNRNPLKEGYILMSFHLMELETVRMK